MNIFSYEDCPITFPKKVKPNTLLHFCGQTTITHIKEVYKQPKSNKILMKDLKTIFLSFSDRYWESIIQK